MCGPCSSSGIHDDASRHKEKEDKDQQRDKKRAKYEYHQNTWNPNMPDDAACLGLIEGDSKLVISWAQGKWRSYEKEYTDRIYQLHNTIEKVTLRPPKQGKELLQWKAREFNTVADEATHRVRENANGLPWINPEWHPQRGQLLKADFDGGLANGIATSAMVMWIARAPGQK